MMLQSLLPLITLCIWVPTSLAWSPPLKNEHQSGPPATRRSFLVDQLASAAVAGSFLVLQPEPAQATRAVGGAEEDCRAAGNCLEIGELDGALGWSWGAKDRCDAADPLCGSDGVLRETPLKGEKVPDTMGYAITHLVEITFVIGRTESLTMRIGVYGNDAPEIVKQFLQFMTTRGLKTTSDLVFENGMGVEAIPVSMTRGGTLNEIVPGERLDLGVPVQSQSYARSKGMSKAGDNFVPQPRPRELKEVPVLRKHDVAGLVSLPSRGLGYGGTGFESEDECFESAFEITASPVPSMDKDWRVVGQLMDDESMVSLARLASLPTKKGFRGVIPGQNAGPPLLKVALSDIEIQAKA